MTDKSPLLSPSKRGLGRGLENSSAKPTDRLAFFLICFICLTGVALVCQIQVAYAPSIWVHLFIALPPVLLACLLPIWLLKGWLIRSRPCFEAEERKNNRDDAQSKPHNGTPNAVNINICNRTRVPN